MDTAPRNEQQSARLTPVSKEERVARIDTIRGVALLGILVMNIVSFGLPEAAYFVPVVAGGFEGANFAVWLFGALFFDMKMMSIFSMLFGAGIVLMSDRAERRGARFVPVHIRRMLWLLAFGMVHAYVIWFGDILVGYAICGLVVVWFRRLPAVWLAGIGSGLLVVPMIIMVLFGLLFLYLKSEGTGPDADPGMVEVWQETLQGFHPTPEMLELERSQVFGGIVPSLYRNAVTAAMMQTFTFAIFLMWRGAGMMLLGMALMKWGVFEGRLTAKREGVLVIAGYGLGLPLVGIGVMRLVRNDFDPVWMFLTDWNFNMVGSIFVALGHIGVILLLCRAGAFGFAQRRLAAVGRMALTNYLAHSIICVLLFAGWGFGLWGQLDRVGLFGVVIAIWIAQLTWSPLWLSRYRRGPFEALWRRLVYGRDTTRQPSA